MSRDDDLAKLLAGSASDPEFSASYHDARQREEIRAVLQKARLAAGFTLADVASRLEIDRDEAESLEIVGADFRVSIVQRYARVLGLGILIDLRSIKLPG